MTTSNTTCVPLSSFTSDLVETIAGPDCDAELGAARARPFSPYTPCIPTPPLAGEVLLACVLTCVSPLPGFIPGVLATVVMGPTVPMVVARVVALLVERVVDDDRLPDCPGRGLVTLSVGGGIIWSGSSTRDLLTTGGAKACTIA